MCLEVIGNPRVSLISCDPGKELFAIKQISVDASEDQVVFSSAYLEVPIHFEKGLVSRPACNHQTLFYKVKVNGLNERLSVRAMLGYHAYLFERDEDHFLFHRVIPWLKGCYLDFIEKKCQDGLPLIISFYEPDILAIGDKHISIQQFRIANPDEFFKVLKILCPAQKYNYDIEKLCNLYREVYNILKGV